MDEKPLFRSESIQARQNLWLGDVLLMRPLSFTFFTTTAVGLALIIVGFFFAASYTQRHTVAGRLVPDVGVIDLYPPQPGIVLKKLVVEGQIVRPGAVLFLVSSDLRGVTNDGVQRAISDQVAQRVQSLRDELRQTRRLQQGESVASQSKINALRTEQENIARQVVGQLKRIELAEEAVGRSRDLFGQGFFAKETVQQKESDLLDQRSRLQILQRDQISVARELLSQQYDLASLPLRHNNQLAQIERAMATTLQEWTESEAKRLVAITAPQGGTVTALTAEVGQTVDIGKPVARIMPLGATLQAHLYAQSRAIGFVKANDHVLIRYQAFPFQKFGHAHGIVMSVSKAAVPASDVAGMPSASLGSGEALYRITVKLERQSLRAYGREQTLLAGMIVEADVLQEKRKLYEWALDPLYSLTGKL